jgi:hypothetical protein
VWQLGIFLQLLPALVDQVQLLKLQEMHQQQFRSFAAVVAAATEAGAPVQEDTAYVNLGIGVAINTATCGRVAYTQMTAEWLHPLHATCMWKNSCTWLHQK